MTADTRTVLKSVLRGVSWLLVTIAGLALWVGGRAISEFAKTDRILGKMLGLGIAVVTGALAFVAKRAADNLESPEDPSSQ